MTGAWPRPVLSARGAGTGRPGGDHGTPAGLKRWTKATTTLLILGAYLVGAIVYSFPLALHLSDGLVSSPDSLFNSWVLAWDAHALVTDPLRLFDANIFYPFPKPLTYSDTMITGALMVAPVQWLTGNPALAHNLLTLASLVLAAWGMYLLVVELTGHRAAAFLCGALFSFSFARQSQLEHVQLLQLCWLPLTFLFLHRAFRRGRTSDYLLFAIFCVCQALAGVYLMYLAAVALGVFLVFELLTSRTLVQPGHARRLAGAGILIGVILAPVALAYGDTQRIFDFHWPTGFVRDMSLAPADFLSVPPRSLVYSASLARFSNAFFANEHVLFPGLVALLFALVALSVGSLTRWSAGARREIIRYALIGVVALVLTVGPSPVVTGLGDGGPLPYDALYHWVPGFASMRMPVRFNLLMSFALVVLAAYGMAYVSAMFERRNAVQVWRRVFWMTGALACVELLSGPVGLRAAPVDGNGVYAWLQTHEPGTVIGELPTTAEGGLAAMDYEYLSTYHWHPLVNGYSGFSPPPYGEVSAQLDAFPDPPAVEYLRGLNVRYLVVHMDKLADATRQRFVDADLTDLGASIAATFGSDVVYELEPLDGVVRWQDHARLEVPPLVARGLPVSVTLSIVNDTPAPMVLPPPGALHAEIQWNGATTSTSPDRDSRLFLAPGDQAVVRFPADVPASLAGASSATLAVRLTGALEAEVAERVEFADDLPSSTHTTGLSGSLEHVGLSPVPRADAWVPLEVIARNTGRGVWLPERASAPSAPGRIGVGVRRWIAPDGTSVPTPGYRTLHLEWTVNPGQAAAFALVIHTPSVPGHYLLELDLVSESLTWFSDLEGGRTTLLPVDVLP